MPLRQPSPLPIRRGPDAFDGHDVGDLLDHAHEGLEVGVAGDVHGEVEDGEAVFQRLDVRRLDVRLALAEDAGDLVQETDTVEGLDTETSGVFFVALRLPL